ncbi:MAG TPA: autotransporter outer membrane beta-barrel domain-containing protein, partial [Polyangiaceae bacterium]|nr:autotransporter outer membrane beta-barrel domain-containing protein [Polyangiaceae bacterium]
SGSPDGAWFPAEKQEAPRPAADDLKDDEPDPQPAPKPAPRPRPASAPLPPPSREVPPAYHAPAGTSGHARARRPKGNVGVSLGGTGAAGSLNGTHTMRSEIEGGAVLGLDLQFNLNRHFTLGAYTDFGALERRDGCFGGGECSDSLFRLGISGRYHLNPGRGIDPWVSVGTGVTTLSFQNRPYDGSEQNVTYMGFDLLNLQVGADFALGRVFSLGPFIGLSNGVYTAVASENKDEWSGRSRDNERLSTPTLHTWTTFGVRGRFNFF